MLQCHAKVEMQRFDAFGEDVNHCSIEAEPLTQHQNYQKHAELITQCL